VHGGKRFIVAIIAAVPCV